MNIQYQKIRLSAWLMLFFISSHCVGQFTKSTSCSDSRFDKKVKSYLSYTAPVVSVSKAYQQKTSFTFLDAREYPEYLVSHIPQSRYVGFDKFRIETISDLPKDTKIIVYCSIGYRSEKIATKLIKAGYTQVYNLYGSIFEWANEGYEMTDQNGKPTNRIHTYNKSWSQWVLQPKLKKIW
ncbi:MAG: rhodanese-like domain-containing protein [Saprospiraceae bacterium]|nr:rhodanese-like domain-containing protein [Saprospiraceae bacterium]